MMKTLKKRNVLGRGLGALLDDTPVASGSGLATDKESLSKMKEIPLDQIDVNPFHKRFFIVIPLKCFGEA